MMNDLSITTNSELDVAQIEGMTEEGVEFVDAYGPEDVILDLVVVDSGRIIIPASKLDGLLGAALERALSYTTEDQLHRTFADEADHD